MSAFKWTSRRERAALGLAQGYTQAEAAEQAGITDRTIRRWMQNIEFSTEVDRLSLLMGIAGRAERLRIVMRVARQRIKEECVETDRDLLDWLKFAQSETDGGKFDLSLVFEDLAGKATEREALAALAGAEEDPPPV